MGTRLIEDVVASNGRITVVAERAFHKRFLRSDFYVQYEDSDVVDPMREDIALIPFLLNVAPVAWISGGTYSVPCMSVDLANSLEEIRAVFQRFYPAIPWQGRIRADRLTESIGGGSSNESPLGILFSGGLDSVYESFCAADQRQLLIHTFGVAEPLDHPLSQRRARDYCLDFAATHGHETAFISSNLRWFLDEEKMLAATRAGFAWWPKIQHGIGYAGLAAPLCIQRSISELRLGGAAPAHFGEPHGTHPELSQQIRWDKQTRIRDGSGTSRQAKLRAIIKISQERQDTVKLRVCTDQQAVENCGVCEKCLRTETGLIALGESPKAYGFPFTPGESLRALQTALGAFRVKLDAESSLLDWLAIQNTLRERLDTTPAREIDSSEDGTILHWFASLNLARYRTIAPKARRRQAILRLVLHPKLLVRWFIRWITRIQRGFPARAWRRARSLK